MCSSEIQWSLLTVYCYLFNNVMIYILFTWKWFTRLSRLKNRIDSLDSTLDSTQIKSQPKVKSFRFIVCFEDFIQSDSAQLMLCIWVRAQTCVNPIRPVFVKFPLNKLLSFEVCRKSLVSNYSHFLVSQQPGQHLPDNDQDFSLGWSKTNKLYSIMH